MKRFGIIFPILLAVLAVGCSKDVETERKPSENPWVYDENLPVPIQFGEAGFDVKVRSSFNSLEDLENETLGVFALDLEKGWSDGEGNKDEDAICLDDEAVTCRLDESKGGYMLEFAQTHYYPYKSDRNFSFFAYYKGSNTNSPVYAEDSVKVAITGMNWGSQDVVWARSDAQTLYVKKSDEINPETGHSWGYVPAQKGVDATAYYEGYNASYIRYIAKSKPSSSIDHSYLTHLPTLRFEHKTTCIRLIAVLDKTVASDKDAVPVVESVAISGDEIYTGADFTIVHKDESRQGLFDMSSYEKGQVMLRTDSGSPELNITPTASGVELGGGFFFQPISENSPIVLEVAIRNGSTVETVTLNIDEHIAFKAGFYYNYEIRIYRKAGMELAVAEVSPWLDGWADAGMTGGQLGNDGDPSGM